MARRPVGRAARGRAGEIEAAEREDLVLQGEDEIGTLEAGKFADLVILEADPRTVAPDEIKSIRVMETWMNGNQVYAA